MEKKLKYKDETGKRYGRLTVMKYYGMDKRQGAIWLCKCDCGQEIAVFGKDLRRNNTRSCGCLRRMSFEERRALGFWSGKEKMA